MGTTITQTKVVVPCGADQREAVLTIPGNSTGMVLLAPVEGNGSPDPSVEGVARGASEGGLATLLINALAPSDEGTRELESSVDRLVEGLVGGIDWAQSEESTRGLPLGLFGSGVGAAAAMIAAARRPAAVRALVSLSGRPHLAGEALLKVHCPTLLLVAGRDRAGIVLNEAARKQIFVKPKLEIVPGASHLFNEPGALEMVSRRACEWFRENLGARPG